MATGVTVDFTANLARFTSAMDKATADLNKFQTNAKRMAGNVSSAFAGIGVGLSFAWLGKTISDVAEFNDQMGKSAQKTGTTAKSFSELAYAATLADVEVTTLEKAMGQLAGKLQDARDGGKEANEIFRKLNLDPKQFKDTADAFKAIADRFAELPDDSKKTALAKDLGKAWIDLIPLLNDGAKGLKEAADEAERFGKVVNDDAAKSAQIFNDNLTRLNHGLDGLKIKLAGPIIESLGQFTTAVLEASRTTNAFYAIIAGFGTAGQNANNIGKNITDLQAKIERLKKTRAELDPNKNLANRLNDFVWGDVKTLDRQIELANAELNTLLKMQKQFQAAAKPTGTYADTAPDKKDKITKAKGAKGKSLEELQFDALIDDMQRMKDEQESIYRDIENDNALLADSYAEMMERIKDEQGNDAALQFWADLKDEAKKLYEDSRTPLMEFEDQVKKIKLLFESGLIDPATAGRALNDAYKKFGESTKQTTDEITEFWREAARNMQDVMGNFFFDAMQGKLGDLEQTFKATIDRMVANLLASQLTTFLFGADFGKGGDIGGVVGDLGKWIGEQLPQFDVGTDYVPRDMLAMIHKGEKIIPAALNKPGMGSGGGVSIQMNITTPDANSFRRSMGQIAQEATGALGRARRVS